MTRQSLVRNPLCHLTQGSNQRLSLLPTIVWTTTAPPSALHNDTLGDGFLFGLKGVDRRPDRSRKGVRNESSPLALRRACSVTEGSPSGSSNGYMVYDRNQGRTVSTLKLVTWGETLCLCRNHYGPIEFRCQRGVCCPKIGFSSLTVYMKWIGDGQPWIHGGKGRRFAMATGDGFHFRMCKEIMAPRCTIGDPVARNTLMDIALKNGSDATGTMSLWWSWSEEGISLGVLELLMWMAGVARPKNDSSPPETLSISTMTLDSTFLSRCVHEIVCEDRGVLGGWRLSRVPIAKE